MIELLPALVPGPPESGRLGEPPDVTRIADRKCPVIVVIKRVTSGKRRHVSRRVARIETERQSQVRVRFPESSIRRPPRHQKRRADAWTASEDERQQHRSAMGEL